MTAGQVSCAAAPENFQDIVLTLHRFWADRGCVILQPYDMEVGAGTFPSRHCIAHARPPTLVCCLCAVLAPSDRRPLWRESEPSAALLPVSGDPEALSGRVPRRLSCVIGGIGIDFANHDVRFVEDDWESQTLGAWGLGWEVWCDGMEVSQFTYFQQVAGRDCDPVAGEITYGLERLAMYVLGIENVFDLPYGSGGITYAISSSRPSASIRAGILMSRTPKRCLRISVQLRRNARGFLPPIGSIHAQESPR